MLCFGMGSSGSTVSTSVQVLSSVVGGGRECSKSKSYFVLFNNNQWFMDKVRALLRRAASNAVQVFTVHAVLVIRGKSSVAEKEPRFILFGADFCRVSLACVI